MSISLQPKDITNVQHQVDGKCMCQACSCGRHKCPSPAQKGQYHSSYNSQYPRHQNFKPQGKYKMIHKNFILPQDKFHGQSSYTAQYNQRNNKIQPSTKYTPKGELQLSKEPFQANTSYIQDYLNRGKAQRAERIAHPNHKVIPQGKFDGDSNYHDNFHGTQVQRAKQFKPVQQLKVGGAFEGKTSYLNDFDSKGKPVRAEKVPLPKNQIMPEGKFDGQTNYTHDFISSIGERTKQFKPQGQIKLEGHFQGNSSYTADYENKGKALRAQRIPLPKNQVIPIGKFQGDSNYHQNYLTSKIQKQQKFKPVGQLKVAGGKFQGQSNYVNDYMNKGLGQKAERVPLPRNQVMPEGKFAGDSDYRSNFIPSYSQRPKQFKPQGQLKIGGTFEGSSSYGADYIQKGVGLKSQRIPLPKNQILPQGKFQGNSAYINDYLGSQGQKNPQFKPHGQLKVGQGNFEGHSSYSHDYLSQGKPIRAQRVPLPKNQIMPEGKFQTDSTYHENFIPSKIQKTAQFKPHQQLKVGGSFDGYTSYGNDYSPKKVIKEKCPCDQLSAPRYQTSPKDHLRYNSSSHKWE